MAMNYEELEQELKRMKPRQKLYEIVKTEMQRRGHWKYHKRGKPMPENFKK